ncbi:MAG TPA: class I SAM-dependent methyltransferase [Pseudomonadales bacterium]|jgi:SAM-dependent methyltransferase|nr:SAM-dependent methyltransferase [Gammaproteobacteria bacterium]MDP6025236.1 class I SAM-dependent methyltransferase [Pseudomonadales bacterium]MDP6315321.1 class I SAM-dependent methyltransferase [Pseudomonadales bacterium]MDP7314769.1 class I SAM-dependent methyltransferase [Pseudomonadales bacterium]HJL61006.1 class I SAM-dependent methyltransferase [Pseudomonadales bacterium]|tara:strand:- start:428 stop:1273 length:846 start_codon:yes stop_codon:yes gene_type:complete
MSIDATGPNADQIEFWNGDAGESWARNQQVVDAMMTPLSSAAVSGSGAGSEDRILDIGCGCGSTTINLAELGARVTGIDVSGPMLAIARQRAEVLKLDTDFILADALTYSFDSEYSLLFSRFGVMFFADPIAAFRNLAGGLNQNGRLCFLCWRPARENTWISVPMAATSTHLPPSEPPDPRAPGPFAFADKDYIKEILDSAGYKGIEINPVDETLTIGDSDDIDQALLFYERIGPLSRVIAELQESVRATVRDAVREAVAPHMTENGLSLDGACWLVHATR